MHTNICLVLTTWSHGALSRQSVWCVSYRAGPTVRYDTHNTASHTLVKSQERNHNDQPNIWLNYTRKRMSARKTDADSSMTIIRLVPCKMAQNVEYTSYLNTALVSPAIKHKFLYLMKCVYFRGSGLEDVRKSFVWRSGGLSI